VRRIGDGAAETRTASPSDFAGRRLWFAGRAGGGRFPNQADNQPFASEFFILCPQKIFSALRMHTLRGIYSRGT